MHGGLPPASAFPIIAITLTLTDGSTVSIDDGNAIYAAQQYNLDPRGYSPLRQWALDLTMSQQQPARSDLEVVMTNGASHSIELLMRMLLNVGDSVLVEEFLYTTAIEMVILPVGFKPVPVAMDAEGMHFWFNTHPQVYSKPWIQQTPRKTHP